MPAQHDRAEDETALNPRSRFESKSRGVRARRIIAIVAAGFGAALAVATVAFVLWATDAYSAEATAWETVQSDQRIAVESDGNIVMMTPRLRSNGEGLIFFAGARVDPDAYAATFKNTVAAGTTVIVVRPPLNLAILETRDASDFTGRAPDVDRWAVGGHSMGGVRACGYAQDPQIVALVLLASYCGNDDLSGRADLSVLTLSGTRDSLATPEKIENAASTLPADATFIQIEGVSHAQFGAYGPQDGDGTPTMDNEEARALISDAITEFFAGLPR